MASHVVNLHWLNPDAKEDQRVRLTTEGRSSKSVDCVIEQVDRAIWTCHGDTTQINAQLDLKKVESNLSERQATCCHWWKSTGCSLIGQSVLLRLLRQCLMSLETTVARRRFRRWMRCSESGWWKRSNAQTANAAPLWSFNL